MANAPSYSRKVDFTDRSGDDTDHAGINAELDAVANSFNKANANLQKIQNDDGTLKNGSVTADVLAPSAFESVSRRVFAIETNAENAANSAVTSATAALTAKDMAIAAKIASELARDASKQHSDNAALRLGSAVAAANTATAKATEAATAASYAATSAATVTTKVTQAIASAAAASASESIANAKASAAASSAATAAASAATATTKASEVVASANTANVKATEAASSASETQALLNAFQSTFLGAFASDGDAANFAASKGFALNVGMMYKNTTAAKIRIYKENGWGDYDASAQQSQNESSLSAAAAAASAATANARAVSASAAAAEAATSASSSASSATISASKATEAATSATASAASAADSATSATASQASAASSANSLRDFSDKYRGSLASPPLTRPGGTPLQEGDLFFSSASKSMKVWGGSTWLDAYASFSGAVLAVNNLSDVASAEAARRNLGLVIGTHVLGINGNAASATTANNALTANSAATAVNAQSALKLRTLNWSIEESSGYLYFIYNGVNKARLDQSGNLSVVGNVSAFDSI